MKQNQINDPNIVFLYSFYDRQSESFDTPFFAISDLMAKRHYEIVTRDENSILGAFSHEFDLCRVGLFNKRTGEISSGVQIIIHGKSNTTNHFKEDKQ